MRIFYNSISSIGDLNSAFSFAQNQGHTLYWVDNTNKQPAVYVISAVNITNNSFDRYYVGTNPKVTQTIAFNKFIININNDTIYSY